MKAWHNKTCPRTGQLAWQCLAHNIKKLWHKTLKCDAQADANVRVTTTAPYTIVQIAKNGKIRMLMPEWQKYSPYIFPLGSYQAMLWETENAYLGSTQVCFSNSTWFKYCLRKMDMLWTLLVLLPSICRTIIRQTKGPLDVQQTFIKLIV